MEKMIKKGKLIFIFAFVMAVVAIMCFSVHFERNGTIEAGLLRTDYNYGEFTFLREMELSSGEKAYYYESGNEYYSYLHDNEGYVLLKDENEGTLEYAVNEQGKPVSSGVSYADGGRGVVKMLASEIDYDLDEVKAVTQGLDGMSVIESKPVLASDTGSKTIVNLTVFISFEGDTFTPSSDLINTFNGSSTSLKSYYQVMSNNNITINSQIPYNSNLVYVYQDPKSRDYYNTNGVYRWERESTLVSNAIKSAEEYFNFPASTNLDVNNDGYIDSVSIIVSGSSSSTWGSLLWPHSVSLDAVDGENNSTVINGKKVGKYAFNFEKTITLGVLCHETAHVLGAPDLYHYGSSTQNQDIVTVGKWDLMESNLDMPQYLLSYMRKNYVGGIGDNQIVDITENGVYSLAPVSNATSVNDVIAYKIPTSKEEYFMIEYRRATASGYDSTIPGSGLIIYRIKEPADFANSDGNMNAVYRGTGDKADEVYVFRPQILMKHGQIASTRYNNSVHDVDYAYLSPNNPYFSKVGKEVASESYDFETIYYSDGSNSDIIIEALSISSDSIEFSVRLGQDAVVDDYFDDKISFDSANIVNSTAFAGVSTSISFEEINPQYLSAITLDLLDAEGEIIVTNELNQGRFLEEYESGVRTIKSDFIYADKGNDVEVGVFSSGAFLSENIPVKAVMTIKDADGDTKVIDEIDVQDPAGVGWDTVVGSKTELRAQIVASTKMTVGIKRDGTLDASGTQTTDQWAIEGYEDVISVALGYTHTLMLTESLNVMAVGVDYYSETMVSGWYDVKAVAAGTYCSYGLKTDGTVLAVGLNDKGQLNVDGWSGIKAVSAIGKRVVGLTLTGTVVASGNFTTEDLTALSQVTNAKQVAVGLNYVAVLKNDGSVQVIGTLPSVDLSAFNGIEKISAGAHHLLGIKENGEIVATGDNSYGQSMVSGLYDVIDIAGGEYHSAFLRADGVVEFRGSGSAKYGTNVGIGNLLYDNYVSVSEITGITGVSGGQIKVIKGQSASIGVTYNPDTATYARMIFTVNDISVATVTATDFHKATIYGVNLGETMVTVKDNGTGINTTFKIIVYEEKELSGIAFSESARSILLGGSAYLTLNYLPDGVNESLYLPTYTSSDESVITVSPTGMIEAIGSVGERATIKAKVGDFEASIVITIVSEISAISVDLNGGSTLYRYGEDLDLSRYILKVTIGEQTENTTMTADMISGYDKTDKSSISQLLTVTYMGATTTFSVSVKDYVTGIEKIADPTKRYLYNYDLDTASGGYLVYYASGETEGPNTFLAERFSGYDKGKVGLQYLTYTHTDSVWGTDFTLIEEITVVDYSQSIAFQPVRSTYLYSQALDTTEFVEITMASGSIRQIELAECEVKDVHSPVSDVTSALYSLYSLRVGAHVIEIKYTDPETDEIKTCTTTLSVDISGEYRINGKDEETSCYYYEIGGELYLGLDLVQKGVENVTITNDSSLDIHYELFTIGEGEIPFDNTVIGEQDGLIKIYVNRQTVTSDGVSVASVEVWSLSIATYGLAEATKVEINDGAKTTYTYGDVINGNAGELDVSLKITLGDESVQVIEPMEIVYDSEKIGTQTLMVRYVDQWLELEIEIKDYVVSLAPPQNITILWNEEVSFDVYGVFACEGKRLLEGGEYVVSGYNNQIVGTQTIVITSTSDTSVQTQFRLIVEDAFYDIKIKDTPQTTYSMGDKFNPKSTYTITMISGATKVMDYNDVDFYYTPELNSTSDKIGHSQRISIFYRGEGVANPKQVWSGSCTVPNYVTILEVLQNGTQTEYKYGESLNIVIRATYADGQVTTLNDKNTYSTNYNSKQVGTQTVTVSYVYGGVTYTATVTVKVVDTVSDLSIGALPTLVSYGYGDVINWTGAKVIVTYSAAGKVEYLGTEIKNLNITYNTLVAGSQKVTVECGGVSAFFTVSVSKETLACQERSTDNVKASLAKRQIAVKEPTTISEVVKTLKTSTYLNAVYQSALQGRLDILTNGSKPTATGDKLIFVNAEGVEVFVFKIYLNGDTNGDGKVDASDVPGMAQMLANGTAKSEIMDVNGDGKANLTDLVGYARKTGGGAPREVPIKDVADEIVTPIRLKGREED